LLRFLGERFQAIFVEAEPSVEKPITRAKRAKTILPAAKS